MKKLDPEMKALFEQIGIDDQSNVDEETIDFIYDFVDKHGGVEALRKELPSKPPGNTGENTLTIASYGKCSKISNTFLFLFFNKLLVIRAGIHKPHVRIVNREYPDQTAL